MTSEPRVPSELKKLFDSACDGKLTEAQVEDLENRLRSNRETRRLYFAYFQLHLELYFQTRARRAQRAVEDSIQASPPVDPGWLATLWQGGANAISDIPLITFTVIALVPSFLLVLVAFLVAPHFQGVARDAPPPVARQKVPPRIARQDAPPRTATENYAARLARTVDCVWAQGTVELLDGEQLSPGQQLRILQGLAELVFPDGVRAILEGPATLELESSRRVFLHVGRLAATVPEPAIGFTVRASDAEIIDLGTEFGVLCEPDGSMEVHVFEGEVEAQVGDASAPRQQSPLMPKLHITKGRAVRVQPELTMDAASASSSRVTEIVPATGQFIREVKPSGRRGPSISPDYVDAVKRLQPLGYWRFEHFRNGAVDNAMGNRYPLWPGRGVSLERDENMSNGMAVFQPTDGDDSCFMADQAIRGFEAGNFSMELWVEPSGFQEETLFEVELTSGTRSYAVGAIELQGGSREPKWHRRLRFAYCCEPETAAESMRQTNLISSTLYTPGRWYHVVAVKKDLRLFLYLDGKQVGEGTAPAHVTGDVIPVLGKLARSAQPYPKGRRFSGRLDEVALYGRALTTAEIQEHFEKGKP